MDGSPLDTVDQAILFYLQEDGRRSLTEIADAVNVSDNTVRNRIQKMEDDGVITGSQITVDYDAAGIQHQYLFICTVRVSRREQLAEEVRDLPGVLEVTTLMTGSNNVLVEAAAREKDQITELAYKIDELGVTINDEELIRDQSRRPFSGFRPPDSLRAE